MITMHQTISRKLLKAIEDGKLTKLVRPMSNYWISRYAKAQGEGFKAIDLSSRIGTSLRTVQVKVNYLSIENNKYIAHLGPVLKASDIIEP